MTKLEATYTYPEPIPGFDPVQWKRQVHAEFRRETEGMTREEVREYFRSGAEHFDEEMQQRRAELTKHQEKDNQSEKKTIKKKRKAAPEEAQAFMDICYGCLAELSDEEFEQMKMERSLGE